METTKNANEAFNTLRGWVVENIKGFIRANPIAEGRAAGPAYEPIPTHHKVIGIYYPREYVAILPHVLECEFLSKYNLSKAVINEWIEDGLLVHDKGKNTKCIRTGRLTGGMLEGNFRFHQIPWDKFNPDDED